MVILTPKRIILVAWLLALPACINVEEEIYLNADGSGRIQVSYVAKKEFFQVLPRNENVAFPTSEQDVYRKFDKMEGVKVEGADFTYDEKEELYHMNYLLSFEDISVFNNSNFRFTLPEKGRTRDFSLWIKGGGSDRQLNDENVRRKIFNQALEQSMSPYTLRMTIHFPYPVTESNAQEVSNKTATWEVPIWEIQKADSYLMEATLKAKDSWWEKIRAFF